MEFLLSKTLEKNLVLIYAEIELRFGRVNRLLGIKKQKPPHKNSHIFHKIDNIKFA